MYKRLAETYGWTPDEVNELTLFQLSNYLGAITPEHGRVKLTPEQAMGVLGPRQSRQLGLMGK